MIFNNKDKYEGRWKSGMVGVAKLEHGCGFNHTVCFFNREMDLVH